MAAAWGPDTRTMPMPPLPGGVAMAAMVSVRLICEISAPGRDSSHHTVTECAPRDGTPFRFPVAVCSMLAGRLDLLSNVRPRAYALYAHCFACGKDVRAAVN